jgi:opacity protein-like surface antigen
MKSKFLAAVAVLALAASSFASDVTGKWTAEMTGPNGQTRTSTFDLKAEGEKLTGTVSGGRGGDAPISDGTVKGDEITFNVVRNFQGNEMKIAYKGKVTGDVIKMSVSRPGGDGQTQEFEAKRVK